MQHSPFFSIAMKQGHCSVHLLGPSPVGSLCSHTDAANVGFCLGPILVILLRVLEPHCWVNAEVGPRVPFCLQNELHFPPPLHPFQSLEHLREREAERVHRRFPHEPQETCQLGCQSQDQGSPSLPNSEQKLKKKPLGS